MHIIFCAFVAGAKMMSAQVVNSSSSAFPISRSCVLFNKAGNVPHGIDFF
jgi:hypothetical protein